MLLDIVGLSHDLLFRFKKPKIKLESSMIIISIDVDVGNKYLGVMNKGKNDLNVNYKYSEYEIGKLEEIALPMFLELFNKFEIPVTFALRGQLLELSDSIITDLKESSIRHDIGAHGYYHASYGNLSKHEAELELKLLSKEMNRHHIKPESFVFPKNIIAHLDLLEKYGYKCYRGAGGFPKDDMYIEKHGLLFNVHPSLCIDASARSRSTVFSRKIIDISILKKLPLHIWFHLWNIGNTKELMKKTIKYFFVPIFKYAKKNEKLGTLSFETMNSSIKKINM